MEKRSKREYDADFMAQYYNQIVRKCDDILDLRDKDAADRLTSWDLNRLDTWVDILQYATVRTLDDDSGISVWEGYDYDLNCITDTLPIGLALQEQYEGAPRSLTPLRPELTPEQIDALWNREERVALRVIALTNEPSLTDLQMEYIKNNVEYLDVVKNKTKYEFPDQNIWEGTDYTFTDWDNAIAIGTAFLNGG